MKIAGIDIGTTGCKITVYEQDGSFVSEAYREYQVSKAKGQHEIDGKEVWMSVLDVIRQISPDSDGLKAIGVTSFGETAILLDGDDKPLMNAMLYTDERGTKECEQLVEHFGLKHLADITGVRPHQMYSLPKLMWIKKNRPEIYEKAKRILLFEDYIVYMLCGAAQIDYSLAARTMAFDIKNLNWSKEILDYSGINVEKLPKVVPTGTKAGAIFKETAQLLGIPEDVMIVSGCHDQVAAAIGTGVLEPGMAVDGTGTVECITPVFQGIPESEVLREGSYAIVPYVTKGCYVCYAFSFTGGALLKWYRDQLASCEASAAKALGKNAYDEFNKQVKDEPSGLLVLPHFSGAATPYMDSASKGAIIGITTETTSIDIYRALMEGVTYEMLLNVEYLKRAGIKIEKIRAAGGGATSKLWLQMKADILNIPVTTLGAAQSGTLGCVMMAGIACDIYQNIEEALSIFVKEGKTYYPRKDMNEKYMKEYKKYTKLYEAVKKVLS